MDWKSPFRFARRAAVFSTRYSAARFGFGAKPDFLIIGAQRSGTTTLYDYMCNHASCRPALRKEVDYFTGSASKSHAFYYAHFPLTQARETVAARSWKTGEATPYYLFHPAVAERVYDFSPDIRLIVLLRNPIDRAFSHYLHERRMGRESLSLSDALASEPERLAGLAERLLADKDFISEPHRRHSYVARGRYSEQLARWLSRFSQEQMLIIQSEHFYADPREWTAAALQHIGLSADGFQIPARYEIDTLGRSKQIADRDRALLGNLLKDEPQKLFELTGKKFDWDL